MKKKIILIITVVLTLALLAGGIFVAVVGSSHKDPKDFEAMAASYVGSCGKKATWSLNTLTGKLNIEGTGKLDNFNSPEDVPWMIYSKYIKEVKIESGITQIAPYSFYRAKQLTKVEIPRTVKTIGKYSFYGCSELTTVEFAENSNLKTIGESAFAYCRSMKDFDFPTRLKTISKNAFLCCYSLTDVTLGYSVKSIGENAFSSCSNLKKLRIVNYDCDIFDSDETIYRNVKIEGFSNSTAKEYSDNYLRTYSVIKDIKNINDMKVKLSFTKCVCNGKSKKPTVSIKGLKSGKDYTVNYSKNVNPGIGTVVVSSAGSTLGEVTVEFLIKPQTPQSLRVRKSNENSLILTWNKVYGADGYELYQQINGKWKRIKRTTKTSFEVEELSTCTQYKFKVRAYKKTEAQRIYSNFGSVCTGATCPDEVKMTSVINRGVGRLTIYWNKVSKADGYIIYTSTKKNSGFKKAAVVKGGSRTMCVLQNLTSNQKLYVTVKSYVDCDGEKVISKKGNVIGKSPM